MDSRLDELIVTAAPPVAERTDHLRRDLATVVRESESAAGPRRRSRFRRLGLVGAFAVGAAGLGTVASAAGLLPTPWFDEPVAVHQQPPGTDCDLTFAAREIRDDEHPVGRAERAATVASAQRFLDELDLSTLSVPRAVANSRLADQDAATGDRADLEVLAVSAEVEALLNAHLARQGRSLHAVSLATAGDCTDDGDAR